MEDNMQDNMQDEQLVRFLTPEERIEQLLREADYHSKISYDYYIKAAREKRVAEKCMEEVRKIRRKE